MSIKKILLILLIFLSLILTSLIAASLEELEKSWLELIDRIVREPGSDQLIDLGKRIAAKRRLAEIEVLREAVLDENFEKFIAKLTEANEVREDLFDECLVLFPNLKDEIATFERGDFTKLGTVCPLWKIGYKPRLPQDFGSWFVKAFLKDPFLLDWNLVFFLKNSTNRETVARRIREECEKLKNEEDSYPALYRLVSLAKQLDGASSKLESELSTYMELLTHLQRLANENVSKEELNELSQQLNALTLKKDNLKNLLMHVAERTGTKQVLKDTTKKSLIEKILKNRLLLILPALALLIIFLLPRKLKIKLFTFLRAYKLAIKLCQKELKIKPMNIELRTQLAMLYERTGEMERAFQEYKIVRDLSRMIKKDQTRSRV
ncbi:hypothetical protein [Pseudothermotoga sp.]|uniref:hypothetical protein n=1 Tax=Pseudothermotoga sp. TaxID=2033661 RepID=UPI0031F6B16C